MYSDLSNAIVVLFLNPGVYICGLFLINHQIYLTQRLENWALDELKVDTPFYFKCKRSNNGYPLIIWSWIILHIFNSFHPKLQFTVEFGGNRLNFLYMTIINNEGEGKNLIDCINRHFHEDISIFSLYSFFKKGNDKHGG